MKTLIANLVFLTATLIGAAAETISEWRWEELADENVPRFAQVIPADSDTSFARLKIENPTDRPLETVSRSKSDRRPFLFSQPLGCD